MDLALVVGFLVTGAVHFALWPRSESILADGSNSVWPTSGGTLNILPSIEHYAFSFCAQSFFVYILKSHSLIHSCKIAVRNSEIGRTLPYLILALDPQL